jgi:tellurite resistance protein
MSDKKSIEAQSEFMKSIKDMTDLDLKEAIIRTCVRQAKAEDDLSAEKEAYGAVIKEEKEMRSAYLAVLQLRTEAKRLAEIQGDFEKKSGTKLEAVI